MSKRETKMKKLVIFSGFGETAYPKDLNTKDKTFLEIRSKVLLEYINNTENTKSEDLQEKIDNIDVDECIRCDKFLYINTDYEDVISCNIVEVDTSRPWTIGRYNGAENINYLDYDIIDENMNFCKSKNLY